MYEFVYLFISNSQRKLLQASKQLISRNKPRFSLRSLQKPSNGQSTIDGTTGNDIIRAICAKEKP